MFSAVPTSENTPSECTIYCPCVQHFLIIFNFQKQKMCKNAPFSDLSFKTISAVLTLVYRSVL